MRALVVLAAALAALGASGCRPAPYLVLVDPREPLDPAALEGCGAPEEILSPNEARTCLVVSGHYHRCGVALSRPAGDCVVDSRGELHAIRSQLSDEQYASVGWSRCALGPERDTLLGLPRCVGP
jgi:hypothetical protein